MAPRPVAASSPAAHLTFKSPFIRKQGDSAGSTITNLNVQALETQVQTLKRAIRIMEKNEDEELERLGKKWISVGRDVAWELWKVLKEQKSGSWGDDDEYLTMTKTKTKSSASSGWGYEDDTKKHGPNTADGWGWAQSTSSQAKATGNSLWVSASEVEDADTADASRTGIDEDDTEDGEGDDNKFKEQEDSVGMMLRQLGIATETLGWDDVEGEFVED